jgi:hypothetical protein
MQKISSYLYPNRIELIADLAGFTVEFTTVYQRNIKIYNGIDNVLEFDIKNADQKRIDLSTLTSISLNVMDATGNKLPSSPYVITPTTIKGIGSVIIPRNDLISLTDQFLIYSVTAVKNNMDVILYNNTKFGAVGTIELIGNALPKTKPEREFKTFTGEVDINGFVVNHSSSIPAVYYEAIPTTQINFAITITGFIGTIWLEGTTHSTISLSSYSNAVKLRSFTTGIATTTDVLFNNVDIGDYKYFRILYQGDNPLTPTGTVDKITVI